MESENLFDNSNYLENENEVDENNICCYCGKNIQLMAFNLNGKNFCDVICGKLYGDENDWKTYVYDKARYDSFYKRSLLSGDAKIVYGILKYIDIPLLPRYTNKTSNDHVFRKNEYLHSILDYIKILN